MRIDQRDKVAHGGGEVQYSNFVGYAPRAGYCLCLGGGVLPMLRGRGTTYAQRVGVLPMLRGAGYCLCLGGWGYCLCLGGRRTAYAQRAGKKLTQKYQKVKICIL